MCAGIRAYSNGGSLDYTKKGNVKVLPKIKAYVNGNSLANIIGFCDLVDHYRVTLNSSNGDYFFVYVTDTEGMRFKRLSNGLYGFDTAVDKLETIIPGIPVTHTHLSFPLFPRIKNISVAKKSKERKMQGKCKDE